MARNDTSVDGEIAALKAAVADRDTKLAAAEAERDAAEDRLRALRVPYRVAWPRSFGVPPTAEQTTALLRAVQISFPLFKTKTDEAAATMAAAFRNAFIALSWMPRHPEGNISTSVDNSTWLGRGQDKLVELNIYPADFGLGPFTAAVLAHGDIAHSFDPGRWPHDLVFAMGNYSGRYPDGSGWRRVLETRVFQPSRAYPVSNQRPTEGTFPRPVIRNADGSARQERTYDTW